MESQTGKRVAYYLLEAPACDNQRRYARFLDTCGDTAACR